MSRSSLSKWFDPLWTLFVAGLGWGIVYALIDSLKIIVDSITFSVVRASSPLILSFIVLCGLAFALLSLPLGLLFSVVFGILPTKPKSISLVGGYASCLTAVFVYWTWLGRVDYRIANLFSLGLLILVGGGVYVLSTLWQASRPRISGRLLLFLLWMALFLSTFLVALAHRGLEKGEGEALSAGPDSSGRPNVVLLSIDALRADHVGIYGYEQDTTPHIDALSQRGVVYQKAVSQSPWTLPSFASLFTSLYPVELDVPGEERMMTEVASSARVDLLRTTLPEVFRQEGYQTQGIITNYWLSPVFGFAQGFDGYIQMQALPISFDRLDETSLIVLLKEYWPAGYVRLRALYESVWGPTDNGWDTEAEVMNHYVLDWLEHDAQEPFFLWVHYIDPHMPYDPPERYVPEVEGISPERFDYLRTVWDDLLNNTARIRPADRQALVALYDAEIRVVDEAVGEVIATLDRLGLQERTVVVVLSDHGEELLEHGRFAHGHSLYRELMEVPLIIAGPERWVGSPRVVTSMVGLIDVMPTLLHLIEATLPPEVEGQDILAKNDPLLSSPRYVYGEGLIRHPERKMIQDAQYKLILDPYTGGIELYDLVADPAETHNLVLEEPALVQNLRQQLTAWMEHSAEVAATLPCSGRGSLDLDPSLQEHLREGGY